MKSPIVLAVDTTNLSQAQDWVHATKEFIGMFKLGLEFFLANGINGVERVKETAGEIPLFLDLKLHDIPNTVAGAARAISEIKPDFLTVHASGGTAMVSAAAHALPSTRITAVTVLTSLSLGDIEALGITGDSEEIVTRWAALSVAAGARAIVASPHEVVTLRKNLPGEISIITPGVRPAGAASGDQSRVATPQEAIGWGADYVVIGRPITSGGSLSEIAANAERIFCSL